MAYVYRHIRTDTNQVFYVGIGSDKNYRRAKTKDHRNALWHNIVNKTQRIVEVFIDDISWSDAINKEVEFIQLYGRRDLGLGTLVNMTNGGDGTMGYKTSDETKQKLRVAAKGRKHSAESIEKMKRRTLTDEQKEYRRICSTGRKHTEETLNKMRGRKLPQEVKDIIGMKNRGRVTTESAIKNMREARLRYLAKK